MDSDVPSLPPLFNPFASIERNRSLSERNRTGKIGTMCLLVGRPLLWPPFAPARASCRVGLLTVRRPSAHGCDRNHIPTYARSQSSGLRFPFEPPLLPWVGRPLLWPPFAAVRSTLPRSNLAHDKTIGHACVEALQGHIHRHALAAEIGEVAVVERKLFASVTIRAAA